MSLKPHLRPLVGAFLFGIAASGCPSTPIVPGDEILGTFTINATTLTDSCGFSEVPDGGFTFSTILSRKKDTGQSYLTLSGYARDAGFDGQTLTSFNAAARTFSACNCSNQTTVEEIIEIVLLSRSQNAALQGQCPPLSLLFDGGIPAPDASRGILAPSLQSYGFDAIHACGRLTDKVLPDSPCQCSACALTYSLDSDGGP